MWLYRVCMVCEQALAVLMRPWAPPFRPSVLQCFPCCRRARPGLVAPARVCWVIPTLGFGPTICRHSITAPHSRHPISCGADEGGGITECGWIVVAWRSITKGNLDGFAVGLYCPTGRSNTLRYRLLVETCCVMSSRILKRHS